MSATSIAVAAEDRLNRAGGERAVRELARLRLQPFADAASLRVPTKALSVGMKPHTRYSPPDRGSVLGVVSQEVVHLV